MANTQYKLSILIGVLDKASAPFRRMAEHVDRLADRAEQASTRTTKLGDGLRRVGSSLSRIGRAAGLRRIADAATKASQRIGALGGQVARLGAGIGALGGGAAYGLQRLFIAPTAQAEDYRVTMDVLMGTAKKGAQAMRWIEDFTARTPYQLAEVTSAFLKAKNFGIDPMTDSLRIMGDTAAGNIGKTMDDVVEALGDAQVGENERLKEFGIRASKQGEWIAYEYDLNGKTMVTKARANSREMIRETVLAIWNAKYEGLMEKRSRTWGGMISNMMDWFTKLSKMVMNSGPFYYLKKQLKGLLVHLEYLENKGTLKKWAETLGRNMLQAFREIWAGLQKLWSGLQWLEGKLGGWDKVLVVLAAVLAGPLVASLITATAAVVQLGVALMATPVGWILGAIALIAGAVYLIYRNWGSIVAWFTDKRDALYAVFDQIVDGAAEAVGAFFAKVGEIAGAIGDYFAGIDLSETGGRIIGSLWDGLKASWAKVADWFSGVGDKISSWLPSWLGGEDDAASAGSDGPRATGAAQVMQRAAAQGTLAPGRQTVRTEVHIKADNLPPGMAVSTPKGEADRTDVDLGYSRAGGY